VRTSSEYIYACLPTLKSCHQFTGITSLLSLTWITLLSVVAYTRFTLSSRPERPYALTDFCNASHNSPLETFIVVLVLVNLLTVILLPIMFVFVLHPHRQC